MNHQTQPLLNLLTATNVGVVRQKKTILKDIHLVMNKNDFITIVGPNGAGKSTLLKVLMGVESISSGYIQRADHLKIGYVPQTFYLNPTLPLSVERFLRLAQKTIPKEVDNILTQLDLIQLKNVSLHQLSGGERQRVLMARALLTKPDLLVLDEPAQNLDVQAQLKLYTILTELYQQANMSILMVSHDLHLVMSLTTQVICLYKHICCVGTPQGVSKDPAFIQLFGKEFAEMMTVYNHQHDHGHHHD